MKREKLEQKIREHAADFRKRATKDHLDKRHDRIRPDEIKAMWHAFSELDWSFSQIGRLFDRDARQVRRHLEEIQRTHEAEVRAEAEVDPVRLDHLKALKGFLHEDSDFRSSFSVEAPDSMMEWMYPLGSGRGILVAVWEVLPWESLPIVRRIRDHYPKHQLWEHIEEWKRMRVVYWQSTIDIGQKLRAEFREGLNFPASEICQPEQEERLLLDISKWLMGQLLGRIPRHGFVRIEGLIPKAGAPRFRLVWGKSCYAEGTPEEIGCAERAIEDLANRWADSKDIRSAVHRYYALKVLAQTINNEIEQVDEAALAEGSCEDCPVLRSK